MIFDNRFIRELPADLESDNFIRQVYSACYSKCQPTAVSKPQVVCVNQALAKQLGLTSEFVRSQTFADVFTGNKLMEGMAPYAMCYGGHQFGNWAGQLGDGRAINLGEVVTEKVHQTLQLKGAGATPYSRHADGLAVLRSSIREYLCSEAMHHLGVPTTRALSLALTGEQVERDMFYDGRSALEPGAVVCRVSPSFIRFGSFQIFSARNDLETLKQLVDFCIRYDFPDLYDANSAESNKEQYYLRWFEEVVNRSCEMVVHWQRVGFVHGVMNTDNMSILGLTIDYGPYGWIDNYDLKWTPNTTDLPGRRYCFGNQPQMVHWNLFQLAQALVPLIRNTEALQSILNGFMADYESRYLMMMGSKLGLERIDLSFVTELEDLLHIGEVDMTLFFRQLAEYQAGGKLTFFADSFYARESLDENYVQRFERWLGLYSDQVRLGVIARRDAMNAVNPKLVLRNYLAQQAIEASEKGDYTMLHELELALQKPYDDDRRYHKFASKRPDWAKQKPGCSMLSCSS